MNSRNWERLVWLYPAGWVLGIAAIVVASQLGLLANVGKCSNVGEIKFGFMLGMRPIPVHCSIYHHWSWQ